MKTNLVIYTLILATVFTFWCSCKSVAPQSSESQGTQFIIVKSADMMRSEIAAENAVVLITDKDTIARYVKLFSDNQTRGHACGYHYEILFWDSPENLSMAFPFNQDCEEFRYNDAAIQDIMQGYRKVLETAPPHYYFKLKVPVAMSPSVVGPQLEKAGLFYVHLWGTTKHLPMLTFRYKQVSPIVSKDRSQWQKEQEENKRLAMEKMGQITAAISLFATMEDSTEISFPYQGFGGGKIEDEAEITLWFKAGTDMEAVMATVTNLGGTIEEVKVPEHYFVYIIEPLNDPRKVQAKLKGLEQITVVD